MNYAENSQILCDFERLIKHFDRKSDIEDMADNLTCFLLEMIRQGKCISTRYVAVAIRNEYIRYSCKIQRLRNNESCFDEYNEPNEITENNDLKILLTDSLRRLTKKQKNAVVLRFVSGYSFDEIAKMNGTTRQAEHRNAKRGLDRLRALM